MHVHVINMQCHEFILISSLAIIVMSIIAYQACNYKKMPLDDTDGTGTRRSILHDAIIDLYNLRRLIRI